MKMVIDISEELYKEICPIEYIYGLSIVKNKQLFYQLIYAIQDGTPLPKGHGRLIDADKVLDDIEKKNPVFVSETEKRKRYARLVYYWAVKNAPTIIERSENELVEKEPQKDTETYICDPEKNTECKKTHCQTLCFKTTEPRYRETDEEESDSE